MAIIDLPTPTDSKPGLRSYHEAASYLVQTEQRLSLEGDLPCLVEPCDEDPAKADQPSPACGSPPRFRPSTSPSSTSKSSTPPSRCRSRTPSPPHPSLSSRETSKAPRCVSPGGTTASSPHSALRRAVTCRRSATPPSSSSAPLRVTWAENLVSCVRTRPRTLRKDVAALFYSRADERRFRQEAAFAVDDDDWCESLEEDSLTSLPEDDEQEDPSSGGQQHAGLWSPSKERKDYGISKAVVVFGDATMTYGGGLAGNCALEAALEAEKASSFSFDDAAFWNGQLTWS